MIIACRFSGNLFKPIRPDFWTDFWNNLKSLLRFLYKIFHIRILRFIQHINIDSKLKYIYSNYFDIPNPTGVYR